MAKFFKVTATGLDGIRKDVYRVKKSLQKPIEQGLSLMADEMTTILQRHIHDDWFADRWQPVQYIRRTNGEGVGLGDRSNMKPVVKDSTLFYEYSPTTDHYVSDWDDHNPDLMIYRIENNELWKYPPTDRHGEEGEVIPIRPRPFWHNFLEEIKGNNDLMYAFNSVFLRMDGVKLELDGKDIEWGANEGEITSSSLGDNTVTDYMPNRFSTFDNYRDEYFNGGWDGDELEL